MDLLPMDPPVAGRLELPAELELREIEAPLEPRLELAELRENELLRLEEMELREEEEL